MLGRQRIWSGVVAFVVALAVAGCALVAPYDATFDQSLNQLSSDTAKFVAAAAAGGPERSVTSQAAVAYYAATYDLLDRLSARARLGRAGLACPANAGLKVFWQQPGSSSPLPADFESFDCREHQLYAVRHFVDQLKYAHALPGGLNRGRAKVDGGALQTAILGTIQTFIVTKPLSG
jgi:hypothetical protein